MMNNNELFGKTNEKRLLKLTGFGINKNKVKTAVTFLMIIALVFTSFSPVAGILGLAPDAPGSGEGSEQNKTSVYAPESLENPDDTIYIIEDWQIPLSPWWGDSGASTWALWNLILSIAGAILALMMGIRILLSKKRDSDGYGGIYDAAEEDEDRKNNKLLLVLAIPFLAIIAIIIFILSQDMRQSMTTVDWWTLVHITLFIAGLLSYIFAFKRRKDENTFNPKMMTRV